MKFEICLLLILFAIESIVQGQFNSGYEPRARGGHFISNGRYQNQAPPQQNNYNNQPNYNNYQPQTANNVIGNTAENTFGNNAVNSIIGSRFAENAVNSIINPSQGSANNVIGNRAYNTQGGHVNSVFNGP
jgi:hypothetical protein